MLKLLTWLTGPGFYLALAAPLALFCGYCFAKAFLE